MGGYLEGISRKGEERKERTLRGKEDGSVLHVYLGIQNKETHQTLFKNGGRRNIRE
jgi:hypothetical protein